jgi:hypothetical protein
VLIMVLSFIEVDRASQHHDAGRGRDRSARILADGFGLSRAGIGAVLHRVAKVLVVPGSLDQIDAQTQQRKKAPITEIGLDPPANTGPRISVSASADPADSQVNKHC